VGRRRPISYGNLSTSKTFGPSKSDRQDSIETQEQMMGSTVVKTKGVVNQTAGAIKKGGGQGFRQCEAQG
jgi:hypothetical protein